MCETIRLFEQLELHAPYFSVLLGRTHVQKVADKRKAELETFLRELLTLSREISEVISLFSFSLPLLLVAFPFTLSLTLPLHIHMHVGIIQSNFNDVL